MDLGEKDDFELENRSMDPLNCSSSMSSGWQLSSDHLTNTTSMGLVPTGHSSVVTKGNLTVPSCSSTSMVASFSPSFSNNSPNLGFYDIHSHATSSNAFGINIGNRAVDMGWNPSNLAMKGGVSLPNMPGMPSSLSQLPTDSAFIDRAARFSCFSVGNFGDMVSPFTTPESMGLYSRGTGMMHSVQEVSSSNGLGSGLVGQSQQDEQSAGAASKGGVSLSVEYVATGNSPSKNERILLRPHDKAGQGIGGSANESDEDEYSGGGRDEPSMLEGTGGGGSSGMGLGLKKRKRVGQNIGVDQANEASQQTESAMDDTEIPQKGDQNPNFTTDKATGKHIKQGSQASDPPKEDYIHIRARRGQATNSHSLAERVRREKISERMKFLQDLVPGCSKVTGKAVMLDEIINYVQSLQRQVEFLSMKLATVNPRLDFNLEGLLAKDTLQAQLGASSTLGFSPDMSLAFPPLQPSQQGFIPPGLSGIGGVSDILRRTINSPLTPITDGFKESSQLSHAWEDELHNMFQLSYGTTAPSNNQDVDVSNLPSNMKSEL